MTPEQIAIRAAENMRNLTTKEQKRELAHELCRYYMALLNGAVAPRSSKQEHR